MKTVKELAKLVGGTVIGNENAQVTGITNIETPLAGHISFVQSGRDLKRLEETDIACLIVSAKITQSTKPLIQVPLPKLAWAQLLRAFHPTPTPSGKISNQAAIATSAKIGSNVTIQPFAVIEDDAEVGDGTLISSHVVISRKVKVGANCTLMPQVILYPECEVGNRVTIHSGSVIGADGFGYVPTPQGHQKIPQVGNVIIEDDVEIGACTTIDCATVGSTKIGCGCKIDNLVQIGHNVSLGPHTIISAQTGISGSSKIGSFVTMGGKVGLGDHVEIGDQTMVGAGAGFPSGKKVGPKQIVFGQPARPYQEARKQIAAQLRSAEMLGDIRVLKKKIAELEAQFGNNDA